MLTQDDFQGFIATALNAGNNRYPDLTPLYAAKDPRILASLDAMAKMLAMLAEQLDDALTEPFTLSKDTSVFAAAALRGIVNKAKSARVVILARNSSDQAIRIDVGDLLSDVIGNDYMAEVAVTVPAASGGGSSLSPGEAYFPAVQRKTVLLNHTVTASQAFYRIEIPVQEGLYLASIAVQSTVPVQGGTATSLQAYEYRDRYVNSQVGEPIYNVDADEKQRVYVVFGMAGVVGVQPQQGQVMNLTVNYCAGKITTELGTPLSLAQPTVLDLSLYIITDAGADPLPTATLRQLCKYPTVYDGSAVLLGEFDYLLNRTFPDLKFLSVWNEAREEQVRGINVNNVNTLMVACYQDVEPILAETDPIHSPVLPDVIADSGLSALQSAIKTALNKTDSGYRVRFLTPVTAPIGMIVNASVASIYAPADVSNRISALLLAEFGQDSSNAKRKILPTERRIQELLRQNLPEIADKWAELAVTIVYYPNDTRPELYRYVTAASLSVNVTRHSQKVPMWGD